MSGVEGAPRIPMLACEPKIAMSCVDFGPKLTEHIQSHYGEDPSKFEAAITDLNNLRELCCRCSADPEGIAATQKYFAQLSVLASRFPMEAGEEAAVPFTWFDRLEKSMDLPNPAAFDDVNFELACAMHNLAALHSLRAANEPRVELESVKISFTHFQRAAWAFQYCRDNLSATSYSVDFDPLVLSFYAQLMLAQAQECVVEKSLVDGRRNATVARYENAGKENNFIYHDKVPEFASLEAIKGVCLVKPIGFDPLDPSISGADPFASLLPLPVVKAVSVFSEMKAKLMRRIGATVQAKDDELQTFLASLHLDTIDLSPPNIGTDPNDSGSVPESLQRASAALHAQPNAVPKVVDGLERLAACYKEATKMLDELKERHGDMQATLDTLKNSDNSLAATARDAFDELRHYEKAHERAASNNSELRTAVAAHSDDLKLLALPLIELRQQLPACSDDFANAPETTELRRLLAKVDEMTTQRNNLVQRLREKLDGDDPTQKLLSLKHFDATEMLENELKKYDSDIEVIETNLRAQANILNALTDANAKFALLRQKAEGINKQRSDKISALVSAAEAFANVSAKCEAGRQFYARYLAKLRQLDERFDQIDEQLQEAAEKDVHRQNQLDVDRANARAAAATSPSASCNGAAPPPLPTAGAAPPPTSGRPRLADYLEYYRAKKAGATGAMPADVAPSAANVPQPREQQFVVPPGHVPQPRQFGVPEEHLPQPRQFGVPEEHLPQRHQPGMFAVPQSAQPMPPTGTIYEPLFFGAMPGATAAGLAATSQIGRQAWQQTPLPSDPNLAGWVTSAAGGVMATGQTSFGVASQPTQQQHQTWIHGGVDPPTSFSTVNAAVGPVATPAVQTQLHGTSTIGSTALPSAPVVMHQPDGMMQQHHQPNVSVQPYQQPNVSMQQQQQPNVSIQYHQQPNVSMQHHHQPNVSMQQHQQPNVSMQQHQQPNVSMQQHQQPNVSMQQHQQPNVSMQHHQQPNVSMQQHNQTNVSMQQHSQTNGSMQQHNQPNVQMQQNQQPGATMHQHQQPNVSMQQPNQPNVSLQQPGVMMQQHHHPGATMQQHHHPGATMQQQQQCNVSMQNQLLFSTPSQMAVNSQHPSASVAQRPQSSVATQQQPVVTMHQQPIAAVPSQPPTMHAHYAPESAAASTFVGQPAASVASTASMPHVPFNSNAAAIVSGQAGNSNFGMSEARPAGVQQPLPYGDAMSQSFGSMAPAPVASISHQPSARPSAPPTQLTSGTTVSHFNGTVLTSPVNSLAAQNGSPAPAMQSQSTYIAQTSNASSILDNVAAGDRNVPLKPVFSPMPLGAINGTSKSPWHVGLSAAQLQQVNNQRPHVAAATSQWHCGLSMQANDGNSASGENTPQSQTAAQNANFPKRQSGVSLLDEPLEASGPVLAAPLLPSTAK